MRAVADGETNWGRFRGEYAELNLEDVGVGAWPSWLTAGMVRARRKSWQHVAVFTPELCLSLAAVNAGVLNSAFVCAVERGTGSVADFSLVRLPGVVHVPGRVSGASFGWRTRELTVEYRHKSPLEGEISVVTKPGAGRAAVVAELSFAPADVDTPALSTLLPFRSGLPFYSLKGPCRVSGSVRVGHREYKVDGERDLLLLDYHRASYPWKTQWRWATLGWRMPDGRCATLNLTKNIIDDERHGNENVLWCGEVLEELANARFEVPADLGGNWHVGTEDGSVNLEFRPFASRRDSTGAGPVSSAYAQLFGRFYGSVVSGSGERILVEDVVGVVEDHNVRW